MGRNDAAYYAGPAILVLLCLFLAAPASGFDFSQYEAKSLKEIAAIIAEDARVDEIEDYTGVEEKLSFYLLAPYRVRVCPSSGPVRLSEFTAGKLDFYLQNLRNKFTPEFRALYNHELVVEDGGNTFVFAFQDALVPDFVAEVRPGDCADLYARLAVYDFVTKKTILLVTEFMAICRECEEEKAG